MGLRLSLMARNEITKSLARKYYKASKKDRGKMLDDICELTGYCRDYARKKLRAAGNTSYKPQRKKYRRRKYSKESEVLLANV